MRYRVPVRPTRVHMAALGCACHTSVESADGGFDLVFEPEDAGRVKAGHIPITGVLVEGCERGRAAHQGIIWPIDSVSAGGIVRAVVRDFNRIELVVEAG